MPSYHKISPAFHVPLLRPVVLDPLDCGESEPTLAAAVEVELELGPYSGCAQWWAEFHHSHPEHTIPNPQGLPPRDHSRAVHILAQCKWVGAFALLLGLVQEGDTVTSAPLPISVPLNHWITDLEFAFCFFPRVSVTLLPPLLCHSYIFFLINLQLIVTLMKALVSVCFCHIVMLGRLLLWPAPLIFHFIEFW